LELQTVSKLRRSEIDTGASGPAVSGPSCLAERPMSTISPPTLAVPGLAALDPCVCLEAGKSKKQSLI